MTEEPGRGAPAAPPGVLTIVGAGPGIGVALARRFGREGFAVGLVARDRARLEGLVADLAASGVRADSATADARDPVQLRAALGELAGRLGPVDVLCFSPLPDVALIKPVLETTPQDLLASLELGVVGAAAAIGEVLPAMRRRGRGTVLLTTGSGALSPDPDRAASGVTTTATTVYARLLHEALATEGVHVAHTVVVGAVGPGLRHEPDAVAEHLWQRYAERDLTSSVIR